MKLNCLAFGLCVLLVAGIRPASADEAAVSGVGGNISMLSGHPTISMVSEIVKIRLPEGKVAAQFVFKNTGPATTVEMGFPEQSNDFEEAPDNAALVTMHGFQSDLDGKPIHVIRSQNAVRVGTGPYTVWWTKRIHFAAGQIHKIHDTYSGGLAYLDPDGVVGFHYILRSGASWKGVIQKATIICDISVMDSHSPLYYQPAVGVRTIGQIKWTLTNLKPKSDIVIAWMNPFGAVSVNGKPVWVPEGHGMVNMGTDVAPRLELSPFAFGWPADKWGGLGSKKVGSDVIVSAKTAAIWLGATLTIGNNGFAAKINRGAYSARLDSPYTNLVAWGGGRKSKVLAYSDGKPLFETAQYFNGDSLPETHGYSAVYLRKIITALGGTSKWDTRLNRLMVTFPASASAKAISHATVTPLPVAPPVVQPTPTPEAPATDDSGPHTVGL